MKPSENQEAAFLATMTANTTHEVRNVLAIVKESAGLIGDLIRVFEKKGTIDPEKLHRAADRIDAQVKRGADHLTSLNRLSHTLDHDRVALDLQDEVRLQAFLSQRLGRKKGILISAPGGDPVPTSPLPPLRVQMAIFAALKCCLEQLPQDATVTLVALSGEDGPQVDLRAGLKGEVEVPGPEGAESWGVLQLLAVGLGGTAAAIPGSYGIRLRFGEDGVK